uniref:Uncharacterized protein n=1 Tax=Sus scrofa TaxID=9823 RepID=A0A8W4FL86_PIG
GAPRPDPSTPGPETRAAPQRLFETSDRAAPAEGEPTSTPHPRSASAQTLISTTSPPAFQFWEHPPGVPRPPPAPQPRSRAQAQRLPEGGARARPAGLPLGSRWAPVPLGHFHQQRRRSVLRPLVLEAGAPARLPNPRPRAQRPTHCSYGGSQARGRIGVVAAGLHHSHSRLRAASATYTTAYGNAGSLTHGARPGIEPASSWFLVGFVNHWATTGTPSMY